MNERLSGKVVIVTGAGSVGEGVGNGRAAAIVYAREKATVLLVDINETAAEATKKIIDEEEGRCSTLQADVSKTEGCQEIVETCLERYGSVNVLHNNVGIEIPGGLAATTEDEWDRTMAVNLKSMFLLSKEMVPHMAKQGNGAIVNISSINAIRTLPALSLAYAVSKAGVVAFTREVAVEYAPKGIRCNAILPGMMATPFVAASLTASYGGNLKAMMKDRDQFCPMEKQGEGWDVAYAALFLASDEAKYITGATLVVDGAQTAKI